MFARCLFDRVNGVLQTALCKDAVEWSERPAGWW